MISGQVTGPTRRKSIQQDDRNQDEMSDVKRNLGSILVHTRNWCDAYPDYTIVSHRFIELRCHTEIRQLNRSILRRKDIRALDIAMDDTLRVKIMESPQHLRN